MIGDPNDKTNFPHELFYFIMLLGTLDASLLGNLLTGKGVNKKGKGIHRAAEGTVRAGEGNKMDF